MSAQARVLIVDDEPPFCKMIQDSLFVITGRGAYYRKCHVK